MCELFGRLARREDQRNRLGQQSPGHERKRVRGRPIEPLRVIDDAQKRLLGGHLRQQAQHREPDQEPIRRVPPTHAERRAKRPALRTRQQRQAIQHRRAQLLQGRERELHLPLDTGGPRDPETRRRLDRVFQQRRLTDPRLASHNQRTALPTARRLEQPVEHLALAAPAEQLLSRPPRDHAAPNIPRPQRLSTPSAPMRSSGCGLRVFLIRRPLIVATIALIPTQGASMPRGGHITSLLGTTRRSDGEQQVTYSGHPVYLFAGDKKPGETNGPDLTAFGGGWFAFSPAGEQVSGKASSSGGNGVY